MTGSRAASVLRSTNRVGGSGPSLASTSSSAPSTIVRPRSTSPPKSAWPGVSTMFTLVSPTRTAVFLARIVIPFSRSRSSESITRSATSSFARNEPACQSSASTSVVLPWSTCATIATFRRSSRVFIPLAIAGTATRLTLAAPVRSPAVPEYVFTMIRASKFYGAERKVLDEITLAFLPGAKIGVLGPNGAGKSTLLRIMAGREEPSSGRAELAAGATVGLLEQEPQLDPGKDVRGNVEDGIRHVRALLTRFEEISAAFAEPEADFDALIAEQATVQEQIDRAGAWSLDATIDRAMDALRLPDGDRDVTTLSGGERRRVALARLLLSSPDLLLLDEPTNHLDAESVRWLERFLAEYKGTVVAVTHDRYFLDNVAGWILELDRGRGLPFQGNYSSWLEQKQERLTHEEKQESARRRTLARELEWVRASPRARHAKSKARLGAYEQLLAEEQNVKLDRVEIHIPPGPRLGDVVIDAEDVRKGFGNRLLVDDLTFSLPPAGIVGVIGPNGAGKTTLFRMIAGEEQPDDGTLRIGDTVELAYVDQARADLDPANNVWKEISGGHDTIELGKREVNSRQYVSWFNFKSSDQQKRVSDLSGGERNRVHLAKLLRSGGNVLLLDEPTNDLDVDTLRALEEALLEFAGCAVVITHDRWFLDRVATHILAFEGNSETIWFEGSWGEYVDWMKETRGPDALEPHRIKYKPLVRG